MTRRLPPRRAAWDSAEWGGCVRPASQQLVQLASWCAPAPSACARYPARGHPRCARVSLHAQRRGGGGPRAGGFSVRVARFVIRFGRREAVSTRRDVELALALAEHALALGAHLIARAYDVRADCAPVRRPSGSGSRSRRGGEDAGTAGDGPAAACRKRLGAHATAGTPNDRSRETDAFAFAFEENTGGVCGAATSGSVDETRCAATTPPRASSAPGDIFFPRLSFAEPLIQRAPLVQSLVRRWRRDPRAVAAGGTDASLATADGSSRLFVPFNFAARPCRRRTRKIGRTRGGQNRISFAFLALLAAQRLLQLAHPARARRHPPSHEGTGPRACAPRAETRARRASRCAGREGAAVRKGVSSSQHLGRGVPKVQVGGIENTLA